ncbi:pentatricopeptide repeat-containing protein At5g50390, chloroplastic [Mercurialis annua]|uniref:pentatricopeptide repeat-containing protein At5g50390, chloroplastic n=1 Tax=Mercurialis annua TaxID=3986 RepID=UPI00215E240F|nr:pentatricopeptide repeat-containing protein At5g50390, chloroplastic [Mercurialis annua]
MDVPLLRYQSLSLDQFRDNYSLLSSSKCINQINLFSIYGFTFSRRKWSTPVAITNQSYSLDRGLQPRPKPISKPLIDLGKRTNIENTHVKKSSIRICSQIEKLVVHGRYIDALDLFEILELDGGFDVSTTTFDALVAACIGLRSIPGVKRVLSYMLGNGFEPDQYMANRILLMQVKCGMIIHARKWFDEMPEKNLASWNTIISGLVDVGDYRESFRLFLIMWEEFSDVGSRAFSIMIHASSRMGWISTGRQLHACALKMEAGDDVFISCALIDMYGKCGSLEDAQCVFDEMPDKNTVAWNTIIAGYALHGYSEEALDIVYGMRVSGFRMDHFTLSIVVRICARLASLDYAKQAHAALIRHGFESDMVANSALVDFYSKWGRVQTAQNVFDQMSCKNIICWNALIAGYGNHGNGDEAIELFEEMLEERMRPNHVTFLAVLSACSYSGLSARGWEIFQAMEKEYKVIPRAMHYACMIELLGREGLLDEAFALIRRAPFKPTANMWAALLTACRIHENVELGKLAAEKLYGMEPEKLNNYIVLLNIYNSSGKLKEAAGVVQTLRRKGLRMLPACSWIEVKKQVHVFHSGDKFHPQRKEIYQKVDDLIKEISKFGYIPEKKSMLPDVDEQEQRLLLYRSEKLAIAFGLINTPYWAPLQVVQGHRLSSDSHEAIKLVAMITRREIVVKDASRFHHFENGSCSCGDYW